MTRLDYLPDDAHTMPGARTWVNDVVQRVSAGQSVIVVVPDVFPCKGAEMILDEVARRVPADPLPPARGSHGFPEQMAEMLGQPATRDDEKKSFRRMVMELGDGPPVVLVRSWEHELVPFLEHLPQLLHERGAAPGLGRTFILFVRYSDLGSIRVAQLRYQPEFALKWWWGVWTRLDTAVATASARPELGEYRRALVTEFAGWNLQLAHEICHRWDGEQNSLAPLTEQILLEGGVHQEDSEQAISEGSPSYECPSGRDLSKSAPDQPGPIELASWARGDLDSWDGWLCHWMAVDPRDPCDVEHVLWRSQVRSALARMGDRRRTAQETVMQLGGPLVSDLAGRVAVSVYPERTWDPEKPWDLRVIQRVAATIPDCKPLSTELRRVADQRNKLAHYRQLDEISIQEVMRPGSW